MSNEENNIVLSFDNDFKWVTIEKIEDLVEVGFRMGNALSSEPFAKSYSEKMHLYFLKNDNGDVVLNASFYKDDNKMHMTAGKKNMYPSVLLKDYIESLFNHLEIPEQLSLVRYKDA